MLTTMNLSVLVFLFLLPYVAKGSSNYNITSLNNNSGLFYHSLGKADLETGKYTILTFFNLSATDEQYNIIKNYHFKSFSLCTQRNSKGAYTHILFYCQNTLRNLETKILSISKKLITIKHLTGHNLRSRRGLFDGVSYAFNWLFGIPDANDARKYEEAIKSLHNNNVNIELLMRKQISIVSSSIINFNATVQNLRSYEKKLNENINVFNNFSLEVESTLDQLKFQNLVTDQLVTLSEITYDLNDFSESIINAITFARRNILHPKVISPIDLLKELRGIRLTEGKRFPLSLDINHIHAYYDIINLKVAYHDNNLIFAINVPIANDMKFNI